MRPDGAGGERGSVMMEYVILNFMFVVALVIAGYFFTAPDGGAAGQSTYRINRETGALETVANRRTERYGILGQAFLERYRMMVELVSMPYP